MQSETINKVHKENRVAGVVILYNPSDSVYKNIESYRDQVGVLFAYDNSETKNFSLIERLKGNSNIVYLDNGTNRGIAEVLNLAAEKAIGLGYDFLLTMDQDSKAPYNLVATLQKTTQSSENIGIVSPLHSNKFGTHIKSGKETRTVMSAMTSGNLLSLDAYKKNGKFVDDYFIDYVDIEYCIRLNYNNFKVLQINDVIIEHNEANLTEKKFFSKKFYPPNNPPFRLYYKTRNLLYLRESYKKKYPYPLKKEYKIFVKNVLKILLFEKHTYLKVRMILLGMWDYLNRKKGRKF